MVNKLPLIFSIFSTLLALANAQDNYYDYYQNYAQYGKLNIHCIVKAFLKHSPCRKLSPLVLH